MPHHPSRRAFLHSLGLCASAITTYSLQARNGLCAGVMEPPQFDPARRVAIGQKVAATVHPLASQAAARIYAEGGSAIDALVASAFTLSVVDGHNSGIGGGCFILVRTSAGKLHAIDGREMAPAASRPDMYLRDGKPQTEWSQTGPLASGVPGMVLALEELHTRFGKRRWSSLLVPAIEAAEQGYLISRSTEQAIRNEAKSLARFADSKRTLLDLDGKPRRLGDRLIQKDKAATLRSIADEGASWFYRGPFAEQVGRYMKNEGGIMTVDDFAAYHTVWREPLRSAYRRWTICGFPPPSSGGIHVAQMLNILNHFPLEEWAREAPDRFTHVVAEAMKLAFADRAHWLGDADFVPVPRGLIDEAYAKELAHRIDVKESSVVDRHGMPPNIERIFDANKHTTHLTTADDEGNWIAMTATINTTWGSKVMIPGTGVMMNNQMDDFSIAPGTPNAFGLIGAEANAIAAGKRPLSSMSPTIVLDEAENPVLTCGAAGGPRIINAVLQTILGCLDRHIDIEQALAAPRIHHQWRPDELLLESAFSKSTFDRLQTMGHNVKERNGLAVAQGIQQTPKGLLAASDPRVEGMAIGIVP